MDTREQLPFDFARFPVRAVRAILATGDYALVGREDHFVVERKRLGEMFSMAGRERDRFERELERMAALPGGGAVVIEGPWSALDLPRWGGSGARAVSPAAVKGWALAWMLRHRIPFLFCQGRDEAEAITFGLLRRVHLDLMKPEVRSHALEVTDA